MYKKADTGYNERLFSGGPRRWLHLARYRWLSASLERLRAPANSVLELGCYDGKLIEHLPAPPERYLGLDANWEGGLDLARSRWQHTNYEFRLCRRPDEMALNGEQFDLVVVMETLEHIPPDLVHPYLAELASATRGYLFVTVPNEIGPVFLAKQAAKRTLGGDRDPHSMAELANQTLGRTSRVARNEHKGFDYRELRDAVAEHFELQEVSGHPLTWLPPVLNFGVGIIGTPSGPAGAGAKAREQNPPPV